MVTGNVAQNTGSAHAEGGSIAVSGTAIITALGSAPARSDYRELVRSIAPSDLLDRESELAQLAAFCTAPDPAPAYLAWRALAWAGKSGLLSWFAMHPPDGVRIVSFFVTARHAGHNDRTGFTELVAGQLAELLGEPAPALTEANAPSVLLDRYARAVQDCAARGERLVLVVDGLDEDRGMTAEADAHSIAALLPARPPTGMRVVVSTRPHPALPADVPDHHPLRDSGTVIDLAESPHTAVIRMDAQRELAHLLRGTEADQDLLGLLAAAGGGLSAADLATLMGAPVWRIEPRLSARTFDRRAGHWNPATPVYVLGHEELHRQTIEELGTERLGSYRTQIHDWAERHQAAGWPDDTPEYLLRGYPELLRSIGDTPRMIACATDRARHDRLLALTGGDSAALLEIAAAARRLADAQPIDLHGIGRLIVWRDALLHRNRNIPRTLPGVLARLGQPDRAEELAGSLPYPVDRVWAMNSIALALADDDPARARALAERVAAQATIEPHLHTQVLGAAARTMIRAGDADRGLALIEAAEGWARRRTEPEPRAEALLGLAHLLSDTEPRRAADLAAEAVRLADDVADVRSQVNILTPVAEVIATAEPAAAGPAITRAAKAARTIEDSVARAEALAELAVVAADADRPGAAALVHEAATLVERPISPDDTYPYPAAVATVATGFAAIGQLNQSVTVARRLDRFMRNRTLTTIARLAAVDHLERAESIAESIDELDERAEALSDIALEIVDDHPDRAAELAAEAERLARASESTHIRVRDFAGIAVALAAAGDRQRARAFAVRAEAAADAMVAVGWRMQWLTEVARAVAAAGEPQRAAALARRSTEHHERNWALTALARQAIDNGELLHAASMVEDITYTETRIELWTQIARAALEGGKTAQAHMSTVRAEDIAERSGSGQIRAAGLAKVASVVAATDDRLRADTLADRAETAARALDDPADRADALAAVAVAVADYDRDRAGALLDEALGLPQRNSSWRDHVAFECVRAAVRMGHVERAERLAQAMTWPHNQDNALLVIGHAAVAADEAERAEAVTASIGDINYRAGLLAAIAVASEPRRVELMAETLRLNGWRTCVRELAKVEPDVLRTVADELVRATERGA
ncbi:hypothetical protein [Dactylosporangium sp. NPDC005555]|uniref:hypothetical protein n=1 Tax=Dactylosporangium sp. NPDC005555 TaxID=3154889 RepID=UPI0033A9D028